MIKTRWLKLFSTRKKKTIFKSKLSPSFLGTALIAVEFPGEPKLCNRIDTWKTVNRILVGGTMVRNRKSARPGVTRIRRRKLFDVRTVYGSGVHNPSLDTIYRGDSVDKWPLVGHVHPQNRNARVPLIDRKPIFARQLSPNTKFSAEENRGGPSIDDSIPALERLNRGCNYSLPPVMPYFDFAWSTRKFRFFERDLIFEQINSKRLNRFPTKRKCIPLQDYSKEIVEIFVIIFENPW